MHTTCSDGALSPAGILEIVRKKKLAAFAITDHDTIDGYHKVKELLNDDDPELITGVELSVIVGDSDLHMLAYLFDPDDEEFNRALTEFQIKRNSRCREIVERLNRQGMPLLFEAVEKAATGKALGRPHVATAMVEQGLVSRFDEAFSEHIGNHCPAYVPKSKLSSEQAINLVHGAGGIAVLAHPFIAEMHQHIDMLIGLGIDGLEVYHYSHKRHNRLLLKKIVARHNLVGTGGSDFHGRHDHESEIGAQQVPADVIKEMKRKALHIRGTA